MSFILRFDDLCPTMNWIIWDKIVDVCISNGIKPIVAVIPDNIDKSLLLHEPREDFWMHIKDLQNRGWTIGLHGYQHNYINKKSGMIGITAASEFVGLSLEKQEEKIKNALKIFYDHGISPDIWIAPSHSFDNNTLKVLKKYGVSVISDGFYKRPVRIKDFIWIPCQLWDKINTNKSGLWTVCIHFNNWTEKNFKNFEEDVIKNKDRFISVDEIMKGNIGPAKIYDRIFHTYNVMLRKIKRIVKIIIRRLSSKRYVV